MERISEFEHNDPSFENEEHEEGDDPIDGVDADATVENAHLRCQIQILVGEVEELAHDKAQAEKRSVNQEREQHPSPPHKHLHLQRIKRDLLTKKRMGLGQTAKGSVRD